MFPVSAARQCCHPSGDCKQAPAKTQSPSPEACTFQQVTITRVATPADAPQTRFVTPEARPSTIALLAAAHYAPRATAVSPDWESPPDLNLLYSVFRI
jgi:hypothetical protein